MSGPVFEMMEVKVPSPPKRKAGKKAKRKRKPEAIVGAFEWGAWCVLSTIAGDRAAAWIGVVPTTGGWYAADNTGAMDTTHKLTRHQARARMTSAANRLAALHADRVAQTMARLAEAPGGQTTSLFN